MNSVKITTKSKLLANAIALWAENNGLTESFKNSIQYKSYIQAGGQEIPDEEVTFDDSEHFDIDHIIEIDLEEDISIEDDDEENEEYN